MRTRVDNFKDNLRENLAPGAWNLKALKSASKWHMYCRCSTACCASALLVCWCRHNPCACCLFLMAMASPDEVRALLLLSPETLVMIFNFLAKSCCKGCRLRGVLPPRLRFFFLLQGASSGTSSGLLRPQSFQLRGVDYAERGRI